MYENLEKFKKEIQQKIGFINKSIPIYWHITGGQRIFAIVINEIIKEQERSNDIMFYLEGNSEKIICIGENKYEFQTKVKYELKDLDFYTVFKLMGYDTKDLDSTIILKGKINKNDKNES